MSDRSKGANSIKRGGGGLALQITKPARKSGLVEEDAEGNAKKRANCRVHAFESLLIVVDLDVVDEEVEAKLVATAARDTKTAYRTMQAEVSIAGNGYQIQLPPAQDAGFREGDKAPVTPVQEFLFIREDSRNSARLVKDLIESVNSLRD